MADCPCGLLPDLAKAGMTVGTKHIGRVLFGMSQYARAHVQHPEHYPWYFTADNLASATILLNALEEL